MFNFFIPIDKTSLELFFIGIDAISDRKVALSFKIIKYI